MWREHNTGGIVTEDAASVRACGAETGQDRSRKSPGALATGADFTG
jgi:hypothetical protein